MPWMFPARFWRACRACATPSSRKDSGHRRDYGETAAEKANKLIQKLALPPVQ